MNRRSFLKIPGIMMAAVVSPSWASSVTGNLAGNLGTTDNWSKDRSIYYNTTNKIILVTKPMTVLQLYSRTMDKFDEPDFMIYEIPMIARTKHYIELIHGWSIGGDSMKMLSEGSIKNGDDLYTGSFEWELIANGYRHKQS